MFACFVQNGCSSGLDLDCSSREEFFDFAVIYCTVASWDHWYVIHVAWHLCAEEYDTFVSVFHTYTCS